MLKESIFLAVLMLFNAAWGQTPSTTPSSQQSMPGMDMSTNHDMMHSMEGHMDMGPHMKMTTLRQAKAGDAERAQQVVDAAHRTAEKYKDYHTALAEGFEIFLPNVPQKMYHFTNRGFISILSIRHRCCMKNMGATTN